MSSELQHLSLGLFLLSRKTLGGAERRFVRFFLRIREQGLRAHLILNEELFSGLQEHEIIREAQEDITVIKSRWSPESDFILPRLFFIFDAIHAVGRAIQDHKLNLLHFCLTWPHIPYYVQRFYRITTGLSIVNNDPLSHATGIGARQIFNRTIDRFSFIDFLSEEIKQAFCKHVPLQKAPPRLSVTPCSFTDYSALTPVPKREDQIVFAARLVPHKNPDLFLRAIPMVLRDLTPDLASRVEFIVLGAGPLERQLRSLAHALNIDHKTKFAYAHRIQDYLASSRIFVSLQDRNNYPSQALLEAMACGNAIVATDVGSTSKLVDSSTGIRVNGTPEEVARALVKLLNHPSQTEQMGEAARKKVTTEHTIEKFTSYLLHDVYLPSVQISQFIQACWAFMFYCGLGILA